MSLRTVTGRKASFSNSPLASPVSPIHRLAARLQDHLHFPDPYPLYIMMATLVANHAIGRAVWLMLVGPPSCGKSELLQSLMSLPRTYEGGSINGQAALLSGSRKKERGADSTGGLLHEIGPRGCLVIKEFNSILSLPFETMKGVLTAFREVYDGNWTRPVGSDGAHREMWEGKLAFITGCTESIDQHQATLSLMGDRFIYYRYDPSDGWSEAFKALGQEDAESLSQTLQALVVQFADELQLDWDKPPSLPLLDQHDKTRLIAFAQIAARGRSSVTRDGYTHEIIHTSVGEYPTRLVKQFSQLLRAMRYIGVDETDAWRIIGKCAFDCMPGVRRFSLLCVLRGGRGIVKIADEVGVSQSTARRALEELKVHGLVNKVEGGWAVSEWISDRLAEAVGKGGPALLRPVNS
jgi:hypothetical protein